MTNPSAIVRSLLMWALIVPIALILGYSLPDLTALQVDGFMVFGVALVLLMVPLFLKYHHPWLLFSWNMSAVIFFLPGRPAFWMAMTAISLCISVLQHTLNPERKHVSVPSLTWPLVMLGLIALIVAKLTGGLGLASMGSETYGGKRYVWIWASILGYFAIASRPIPREKAVLYVSLYFLGGVTMAIGTLFGLLGEGFTWLFRIFPVEMVIDTESSDRLVMRSWALPYMSIAIYCAMIAKYGLRGTFDMRKPWRIISLTFILLVGMMGGFRTMVVILAMITAILFVSEGLLRSRMLPVVLLSLVLGGTLMAVFANRLPLSMQRTLAILPVEIDPLVRWNAEASNKWRLDMWRNLIPEIPQYLILGKGYGFSANDINVLISRMGRSQLSATAGAELVGDYHNGPLSILLPLGLPGTFILLWFFVVGTRVVWFNYKYGDPELKTVNRFIYAYFLTRMIFFLAVFGSLYSDLAIFTGLLGLSVSVNHGLARKAAAPALQPQVSDFQFSPAERPALNV